MHNVTTETLLNQKQAGSIRHLQDKLILREKKYNAQFLTGIQEAKATSNAWYLGIGRFFTGNQTL